MGRYKHLFKNMGLLSISQFGTKILSFLLVPLYTSILTTEEYGTYDLFNTVISLFVPVLTLNISSALIRFPLDNKENPKEIFSIGIKVSNVGTLVFLAIYLLNYKLGVYPLLNEFPLCFILMFVFNVFYNSASLFARGMDNVFAMSVAGVINSFFTLSLNVLFLAYLKWGLIGYFYANILGTAIASIYLFIQLKLWKYIDFRVKNARLRKEMLAYTIPLIANSVSWWINSSLDRLTIVYLFGVSVNGIYSVANKIPSIVQIVQNIFGQAWSLSATKFFDKEDEGGFFSYIYNSYNFILVCGCSIVIIFTRVLAKFLYVADFYEAWRYVPFLTISVVFTAMSGYVGGVFTAIKKSKVIGATTMVGAVLNCVLNFLLAINLGPIGAAVATMISYYITWITRIVVMKKYIQVKLNLIRDHVVYILLLVQSVLMLSFDDSLILYMVEFVIFIVIVILYWKLVIEIISKLFMKIRARGNLNEK